MDTFLKLINEPDIIWLLILIGLLAWIGAKMIASQPDLERWGARLAAGAFVSYALYGFHRFQPTTTEDLVGIVVRGLFAAGLVLGLSWIVLAGPGFFYKRIFLPWRRALQASAELRAWEQKQLNERLEAQRRADEEYHRQQEALANTPPRSERVQRAIQEAKVDYETECAVLRAAGLDADELDSALLNARTKYMRHLKEIIE
jgi:hypothetical protein